MLANRRQTGFLMAVINGCYNEDEWVVKLKIPIKIVIMIDILTFELGTEDIEGFVDVCDVGSNDG